MSNKQDQLLHFTVQFNSVLINSEIPPRERIDKILSLQRDFDILPNQASKVIFALQSNLVLGECYIQSHQKYMLTPVVEDCKKLLLQMEQHDFATQPQSVWSYLAERLEQYYYDLVSLCQAKNHQRDIAYCHQEVARIWDKVGNETNCIKHFVLSNIALAKVPNCFALSKEQLLAQFCDHTELIEQIFVTSKTLKTDPVEQTPEYLAIYDDAERIIQGLIDQQGRLARTPEQYWTIKTEVLELHFGIKWKSPRFFTPGVKF